MTWISQKRQSEWRNRAVPPHRNGDFWHQGDLMLSSLYKYVAVLVFYLGLMFWLKGENGYVRLPALICSMFAFEYLLGVFP